MEILTFVFIATGLLIEISHGQTAWQLSKKFKDMQCTPKIGHEEHIKPCYNFITKKLVPPSDCDLMKNQHCCIYNCTCIMRGAGHGVPEIPKRFVRPETSSDSDEIEVIEGCIPITSEKKASTGELVGKSSKATDAGGDNRQEHKRKWKPASAPKTTTTAKPARKRKFTPTPKPKKKRCTTTASSSAFHSSFASIFSHFGFTLVSNTNDDDC